MRRRLTLGAGWTLIAASVAGAASVLALGGANAQAASFWVACGSVVASIVGLLVLALVVSGSAVVVLASPAFVAAATWLLLFVVRPIELYFAPWHASTAIGQFGFGVDELARTTALGALGCACWSAGYAACVTVAPGATAAPRRRVLRAFSGRAAALTLVVGTALWVLLFIRQGGPAALAHSAVSIRDGQNASSYGFIGVWLVQGATLYALAVWLRERTRSALATLLVGAPISLAASLALQLRALAVFGLFAALVIYVRSRDIRMRHVLIGAVIACVGFVALGFLQQARHYTHRMSTAEAVRLTAETPLWAMYVSDLSTFDSFVAVEVLVPESLPYLRGESLAEIPQVLLPRALWPDKPLGVDVRSGHILYPGTGVANPVSLQGELYWNGGAWLVAVGALALGLLFGILGRVGLRVGPDTPSLLVLYGVAVPFTFAFLTRGLAIMNASLVLALIGTSLAIAVVSPHARASIRSALALRGRRARLAAAQ